MNDPLIRPSHRLAPEEYPEWLQMDVADRLAARRPRWAALALGFAVSAGAGIALAQYAGWLAR